MQEDYSSLGDDFWNAIEEKNEVLLKKLIIKAMRLFLADKISKEDLDGLASLHITAPIQLKWPDNYPFEDARLDYVFTELSAIEVLDDKRAKGNVKRFLLYLEDKDYEHITD